MYLSLLLLAKDLWASISSVLLLCVGSDVVVGGLIFLDSEVSR